MAEQAKSGDLQGVDKVSWAVPRTRCWSWKRGGCAVTSVIVELSNWSNGDFTVVFGE